MVVIMFPVEDADKNEQSKELSIFLGNEKFNT